MATEITITIPDWMHKLFFVVVAIVFSGGLLMVAWFGLQELRGHSRVDQCEVKP